MAIRNISETEFEGATSKGVCLVDFWAPWCGPCRMQGAILESKLAPAKPALDICKVNVDEAPQLAAKFGIESIPTLFVMCDGKVVRQFVGVTRPEEITAALASIGA